MKLILILLSPGQSSSLSTYEIPLRELFEEAGYHAVNELIFGTENVAILIPCLPHPFQILPNIKVPKKEVVFGWSKEAARHIMVATRALGPFTQEKVNVSPGSAEGPLQSSCISFTLVPLYA
jgi:hypothetical protein